MPVTRNDGTVVLALVRGDDRIEPAKLDSALGGPSRPATDDEIRAAFGASGGSLGPVGFKGEVVADEALRHGQFVAGANRDGFHLRGVEAVIDKDLASSLLARSMEADILVLPTGVEKVALDFNKPTQRWLDRMTLAEARKHQADNQFDPGSMGPKIAALVDFVGGGGRMGLITDPPNLSRALRGETGTRLIAK